MIKYNERVDDWKCTRWERRVSRLLAFGALACITSLACRQDSTDAPPNPPANDSAIQAETPPPPTVPHAPAALDAPSDDRPSPPAFAAPKVTVTVLSTEAELDGIASSDSDPPLRITAGRITSTPASPRTQAQPAGEMRQGKKKRMLANTALADIEEEMLTKWKAIQSLSSSIESSYKHDTKERKILTLGVGTRDALMTGGKTRIRSFFENSIRITIETEDPPIRATKQRIKKIFDGDFLYTQFTTHEGTTATKTRSTPRSFMAVGGPGLLAVLRNLSRIRRLPNTQIGDRTMYVLEGYNTTEMRVEYAIDQETGLLYRFSRIQPSKKLEQTLTFTKHDINMGFPPDHFVFTPYEGVEVQDLTQGAASAPSPAPRP